MFMEMICLADEEEVIKAKAARYRTVFGTPNASRCLHVCYPEQKCEAEYIYVVIALQCVVTRSGVSE